MKTVDLYLPVKREYFEQIRDDKKPWEYRLNTPFWRKRLLNKHFDTVTIACGYPKKGDPERTVTYPYRGYVMTRIQHPHFGDQTVEVFAIRVGKVHEDQA